MANPSAYPLSVLPARAAVNGPIVGIADELLSQRKAIVLGVYSDVSLSLRRAALEGSVNLSWAESLDVQSLDLPPDAGMFELRPGLSCGNFA